MELSEDFQEKWNMLEMKFEVHFGKTPDMETILMLIGVQELRRAQKKFTKEEKQDLMHIAVCTVLSKNGYYKLTEYDKDGWPHFAKDKHLPPFTGKEQEDFLKQHIISYFEKEALF